MSPLIAIYAARAISVAWGGFWLWFGLASGIGEGGTPSEVFRHALVPGGIGFVTACVAWRWPGIGGKLLVVEGLLMAGIFAIGLLRPPTVSMAVFLTLTLIVPPIVAGLLFLSGTLSPQAPTHA